MKKVIFGALFVFAATFAMAQSSTTNSTALEILKVTPEIYAQKVQAELQQVCSLKPEQSEKVYNIALSTAEKIHELETYNNSVGNPKHKEYVKRTVGYGDAKIMNILDKNQLASYNKKERILRKDDLVKERQAKAKAYEEAKAKKRN